MSEENNTHTPEQSQAQEQAPRRTEGWLTPSRVIIAIALMAVVTCGILLLKGPQEKTVTAPAVQQKVVTVTLEELEARLKAVREEVQTEAKVAADKAAAEAEELAASIRDRDLVLAQERKQMTDERKRLTEMQADAEAKVLASQKAAEEVAKQTKVKLSGVPTQFEIEPENLKARWLGFDTKQVKGYKVPLMKNSTGKPTPFHPNLDAPVETEPDGNWMVIDYRLLNGVTVQAWAVKL